jgi:RNA polymerase sigma-70 factor, ECF subfamily
MSEQARAAAELDVTRLVADHHRSVYGYALRLSGSPADAEDLTQQAYLTAHQKLDQLRDAGKARSWLLAIVRNCYLKNRGRGLPMVSAEACTGGIDHIPDNEADEAPIDSESLQAALDRLPESLRLVLVMFYFEECSYKQIAEALELPAGTVMSRLSRAKARLRAQLLAGENARLG